MSSNFRSDEFRSNSTSNDIEFFVSPVFHALEIYKDKINQDVLYDFLKVYLDYEFRVKEKELKNIVDDMPLHNAVIEDNEEMVKSLVKKKTIIDSKATFDLTPLHIAAYKGNVRIAEILLNHGASVDSKFIWSEQSFVSLDFAIIGGHINMFKLLLSHGSDKDLLQNYNWRSRLFSSGKNDNGIKVYVLMWHLDNYNKKRQTSLLDAVDSSMIEYRDIVSYLYSARFIQNVCPNKFDNVVILRLLVHKAVKSGYTQVVKDFLIWGAEIGIIDYTNYGYHISNFTLLHSAVIHNQYDIARLLIDHGANVNAQDMTEKSPFAYAFIDRNIKLMELLLRNGASERNESMVFHTAVTLIKSIEVIEVLLRNGLKVNCRNELERTPLHEAASRSDHSTESINENLKIFKLLLRYGADVRARDYTCKTPLHVAAATGNFEAVKALLEHCTEDKGVLNIDATNNVGASALILAAETNNKKIVKILLNYGANINFKREDGKTALIRATEKRHEKVVKLLLEHYADIEVTNSFGLTAIDVAFKKFSLCNAVSYSRIIMLLLESGADVSAINSVHVSTCTSGRMPKCLQQEIIKLKAANMYLDEIKFENIINNPDLKSYRQTCEKEVEKMKKKKLCNSNISMYDILTKDSHRLAFICRNRQIVKTLEAEYYKDAFPIYNQLIENNFLKGLKRQILLDRALSSFSRLIDYEILDVLSADMLTYLSNEDLKNLAEASTL